MTVEVSAHAATGHVSWLLERVATGEKVVIFDAGRPVAELVSHRPAPVEIGAFAHEVSYDDTEFEELDPDIQRLFYGDDAAD
ncbi:hypothetical protein J4H86_10875 [Spiractinospora alimapuensis]|uniref:type II toxin-antitoxin system Phd/YefM family antitoxin n=1 Tax=Spiractinospora alimapuensis TaxID=2820884 RepID=UPI001F40627A|nr:hypothetical protein [Spiractinospora alimapuensis]QVQ54144.1 hypothetical protein J4H86_10875 [Spiractinospora alimapuensis]